MTQSQLDAIALKMGAGWDSARVAAAMTGSTAQQIADLKLLVAVLAVALLDCMATSQSGTGGN